MTRPAVYGIAFAVGVVIGWTLFAVLLAGGSL